jgi:hypothetical protein
MLEQSLRPSSVEGVVRKWQFRRRCHAKLDRKAETFGALFRLSNHYSAVVDSDRSPIRVDPFRHSTNIVTRSAADI